MDDRINKFLVSLEEDGDERFAIVTGLRDMVRSTFPGAEETFKYGGLHYLRDGVPFAGIYAYTRHVSVEINGAARIANPHGHLEGAGGRSGRKHVKLTRVADVADKRVADYLALAWAMM